MATAANFDLSRGSRPRKFANHRAWLVGCLFAALMAAQALGFFLLGTGRSGLGLSESILVLDGLLALACAGIAFRRAQGITALLWFLFAAVRVVLLVPTALQAFDTLFDKEILSDSTRSLLILPLWCPDPDAALPSGDAPSRAGQVRDIPRSLPDRHCRCPHLLHFLFSPMSRMLPDDAVLRGISLSNAQSLLLLIAALLRLQFARVPDTRNLLIRLALFLLVCAVATFVGDWLFLHNSTAGIWFDLGWAVSWVAAGLVAIPWTPSPEAQFSPEPPNFLSFLGTNLVLVALLSCNAWLTDRWKPENLSSTWQSPCRFSPSLSAWPSPSSTSNRK